METNTPSEVAISAVDVHKSYLNDKVLRGFNLTIKAGASFGCAGVNGAGKSTFLKCLLDFCHYSKGTIEIFGKSSKLRDSRNQICFLPERFVPPYYLNGRQFVKFVMSLNNANYDEDKTVAMFEDLDLDLDALKKPTRSFSKGMTQKLGLASIFLLERDLYILDEPMSGLDPKARALLKRVFKKIHANGATLFFTSHALSDIEEICEEMALLHEGKVCYAGTPQGLMESKTGTATLEEAFMEIISAPATTSEQQLA